ncbi:MAG TPA: SRPBCC family protein [Burkholderiales bacterium]|nr:SRPBCC family protein [Burkholderiales bacterium]
MNRLLVGGALGALAMYFLDPREGRRRRARTRDKMVHAGKRLNEAGRVTARDTVHRARGVLATARKLFEYEEVSDAVLVERVRAELGRAVSHPHAVAVAADYGHVTLSGPVLSEEARPLLRCVRGVPGVRAVSDRLTIYEDAEAQHVSSLPGGHPRHGARFGLLQEHWSPAARLAAGTVGAGLLASSFRARAGMRSLLGVAGVALLARSAANKGLLALLGLTGPDHGIMVRKTIHVEASVEKVFTFWTDYQNFPRFMHNVREVEVKEEVSHWVVSGPAGVPVEWNAVLVEAEPNAFLRWRSVFGSAVKHEGFARFEPDGSGTRVTVQLRYVPPGGAFGHAVASLFGADPKSEMDTDLMRMKSMIETGRAPHDAARPLPRES